MMYFARWKTAAILAVCLIGVLLSLPNLFPRAAFPDWLPARQVHLGLDLRGGSYLLLEVDTSAILRERLVALEDAARTGAARANPRILYTGLTANVAERRVTVRASDPARAPDLARILREAAVPVPVGAGATQPDITVEAQPDGTVIAAISEAGLRARAAGAVEQSIEIVRRRIDESGLVDALVARQGLCRSRGARASRCS